MAPACVPAVSQTKTWEGRDAAGRSPRSFSRELAYLPFFLSPRIHITTIKLPRALTPASMYVCTYVYANARRKRLLPPRLPCYISTSPSACVSSRFSLAWEIKMSLSYAKGLAHTHMRYVYPPSTFVSIMAGRSHCLLDEERSHDW
jgi:hypothetical protein